MSRRIINRRSANISWRPTLTLGPPRNIQHQKSTKTCVTKRWPTKGWTLLEFTCFGFDHRSLCSKLHVTSFLMTFWNPKLACSKCNTTQFCCWVTPHDASIFFFGQTKILEFVGESKVRSSTKELPRDFLSEHVVPEQTPKTLCVNVRSLSKFPQFSQDEPFETTQSWSVCCSAQQYASFLDKCHWGFTSLKDLFQYCENTQRNSGVCMHTFACIC